MFAWQKLFQKKLLSKEDFNKIRLPKTAKEFETLGFVQYHCRELFRAVTNTLGPNNDSTRTLKRVFSKCLVAIDNTNENIYGVTWDVSQGFLVIAIKIDIPLYKIFITIPHELAHAARNSKKEPSHNPSHSKLWRQFFDIGMKNIGWEFAGFNYPEVCQHYGELFCDLRTMDTTRVFNSWYGPVYGSKFVEFPVTRLS